MPSTTSRIPLLPTAALTIRPSHDRGHSHIGWLSSYHTFSVPGHYKPDYVQFSSLRIINEDHVARQSGFPTHPHSNMEIFTYVLNGTLTHRDSTVVKSDNTTGVSKDLFYKIKRGDVQFTTAGRGVSHSEENDDPKEEAHFLQIWVYPWKRGLVPRYHTRTFDEDEKRKRFVTIVSPLKAGVMASAEEEKAAVPVVEGSIPIHADCFVGAGIVGVGETFVWRVGGTDGQEEGKREKRKVLVHMPMLKGGRAKVQLMGREEAVMLEGDGAFVTDVVVGDEMAFTSVGEEEAEIVVLDLDQVGNGP